MCLRGQTGQDRTTCLREAEAAYTQATREGLEEDTAQFQANRFRRCERLPMPVPVRLHRTHAGAGAIGGSV